MSFAPSFSRLATRARTGTRYGRLLAIAFLSATLVGTTACGDDDDDNGTGPGSVNGTYTLETVDGESVPTTIANANEGAILINLLSGEAQLTNGDFSAEWTVEYEGTNNPNDTYQVEGTYDLDGTTATFTVGGESVDGTIANGVVTIENVPLLPDIAPELLYTVTFSR
jgi:hypothetical protein